MTRVIVDPGLLHEDVFKSSTLSPTRIRLIAQIRQYYEGILVVEAPSNTGCASTTTAKVRVGQLPITLGSLEIGQVVDIEGFYNGEDVEAVLCTCLNNILAEQIRVLLEIELLGNPK